MELYLRDIVEKMINGLVCPAQDLKSIRDAVPEHVIVKSWNEVILKIFLEKGDTAYARDGYHNAVNLIEKHLLFK